MQKLVMPFLMCLRNGKFKPDEVFTGVDDLEGLTLELKSLNGSNADLIKKPNPYAHLQFTVLAGTKLISQTEFKMGQAFETKIDLEWNHKQFQISFK